MPCPTPRPAAYPETPCGAVADMMVDSGSAESRSSIRKAAASSESFRVRTCSKCARRRSAARPCGPCARKRGGRSRLAASPARPRAHRRRSPPTRRPRESPLRPSDPRFSARCARRSGLPASPRAISTPPPIGRRGECQFAMRAASRLAGEQEPVDGAVGAEAVSERFRPACRNPGSAAQASRLRALFESFSRAATARATCRVARQQRCEAAKCIRAHPGLLARLRSAL